MAFSTNEEQLQGACPGLCDIDVSAPPPPLLYLIVPLTQAAPKAGFLETRLMCQTCNAGQIKMHAQIYNKIALKRLSADKHRAMPNSQKQFYFKHHDSNIETGPTL